MTHTYVRLQVIRSLSLYTFNWAYSKEDGEEGWFSDRVKGRDGIKPERKGKTSGCCLANPCMEKKKTADVFRSKTEKRQKQTDKTKQFTSLGSAFRVAGPYASLLDSCRFFFTPRCSSVLLCVDGLAYERRSIVTIYGSNWHFAGRWPRSLHSGRINNVSLEYLYSSAYESYDWNEPQRIASCCS